MAEAGFEESVELGMVDGDMMDGGREGGREGRGE